MLPVWTTVISLLSNGIVRAPSLGRAQPTPWRTHRRVVANVVAGATNASAADSAFDGAMWNEEQKVTVQYLGGAASRQRRVRRTRRPSPEERWRLSAEPAGYRRMSAFCNFATINLESAMELLASDARFRAFGERMSITSYTDVVHCRFSSPEGSVASAGSVTSAGVRDAFLYPYGATVLWGFASDQELALLDLLSPCCELSTTFNGDDASDSEFMLYTLGPSVPTAPLAVPAAAERVAAATAEAPVQGGATEAAHATTQAAADASAPAPPPTSVGISNNVIRLSASDDAMEKLAISFAFAQSAKLAVFEALLEATTEDIKPIPEQLAASGRSKFTVKQVAKLTGRVFLERNAVNLYSNILDTPDFFWEAEDFEPLYRRVNRYLDIEDRVRIVNQRLDIVNDLLDSLSSQLEIKNSHRLEVIIIALIMFEIVLELLKEVAWLPSPAAALRLPLTVCIRAWRMLASGA